MIDRKVLGLCASCPTCLLLIHRRRTSWLKRAALRHQPDQPQVDQSHGRWIQDICTFVLLIYSTFMTSQPDRNSRRLINASLTEHLALYLQLWKPPIILHT